MECPDGLRPFRLHCDRRQESEHKPDARHKCILSSAPCDYELLLTLLSDRNRKGGNKQVKGHALGTGGCVDLHQQR